MKRTVKLFGLLAVGALAFASCSDDDNDDNVLEPTGVSSDFALNTMATAPSVDISEWTWKDATLSTTTTTASLPTNIDADLTLDASEVYALEGTCVVDNGATLTIPAGTQIVAAAGGTDVYIAVMRGAKIMIDGTADNPVVMSSTDGIMGDWGGLTICGNAVTTAGEDAVAEVGGFIYGGSDAADNSGSIQYLVISGTGAAINDESEYNGVSFYAVGSGTTVANLAVNSGSDDGVEFFGGSVNASNLYLANLDDDACDWTEGWNGTINNIYIVHNTEGFSTAFEGDGQNEWPTFNNVTCMSSVGGIALQFKKQSGANINDLYLDGYDVDLNFPQYTSSVDGNPLVNVQIDGADADAQRIE